MECEGTEEGNYEKNWVTIGQKLWRKCEGIFGKVSGKNQLGGME